MRQSPWASEPLRLASNGLVGRNLSHVSGVKSDRRDQLAPRQRHLRSLASRSPLHMRSRPSCPPRQPAVADTSTAAANSPAGKERQIAQCGTNRVPLARDWRWGSCFSKDEVVEIGSGESRRTPSQIEVTPSMAVASKAVKGLTSGTHKADRVPHGGYAVDGRDDILRVWLPAGREGDRLGSVWNRGSVSRVEENAAVGPHLRKSDRLSSKAIARHSAFCPSLIATLTSEWSKQTDHASPRKGATLSFDRALSSPTRPVRERMMPAGMSARGLGACRTAAARSGARHSVRCTSAPRCDARTRDRSARRATDRRPARATAPRSAASRP